jgi:lysophospholipase
MIGRIMPRAYRKPQPISYEVKELRMRDSLVESAPWECAIAQPDAVYWLPRPGNARLRVARWEPQGPARGTVLVVHGRAEFIEKYVELASELQQRGWRVLVLDLRGHGHSTRPLANPRKGHAADFALWIDDLRAVIDSARAAGWPPVWGIGHSMGGQLLLRLLLQSPNILQAVALTSPMCAINLGPLPEMVGRAIAEAACRAGFSTAYGPGQSDDDVGVASFAGNRLTSDATRFAQTQMLLKADPSLALGGVTYGWLRAAFRSMQTTRRAATADLVLPMHIANATLDQVVRPHAADILARRLPNCSLSHHAGQHELLKEQDAIRAEVWRAFDSLIARAGL